MYKVVYTIYIVINYRIIMKQQINKITKLAYKGSNQSVLNEAKEINGFVSNEWMTFLQAKMYADKLKIKKGSKGTKIFTIIDYINKNSKGRDDLFHGKKNFTVFNLDQTEPVEEKTTEEV